MEDNDEIQEESYQETRKAQAEHHMRMRFGWDDLIEELIQEGQEKGSFDNLRGHGKPLDLKQNSFRGEWDLAHRIMKDNDVVPPWISDRKEALAAVTIFREDLQRQWPRYRQAYQLAAGEGQRTALILEWDERCRAWELQIVRINKGISNFNLRRPRGQDNMELFKLSLTEELQRIGASRNLSK